MTKTALIKKITDYHPASKSGLSRGWSHYVGGMADRGDWYSRKLLKASQAQLQECLDELIEENKPKQERVLTEEERQSKSIILLPNNGFITELMQNDLKKLHDEHEMRLWLGSDK